MSALLGMLAGVNLAIGVAAANPINLAVGIFCLFVLVVR